MRTRQLRALRGASAAVIAVLLAAVSHTFGGGAAPSLAVLLGVSALAWPVTTVLVGRRLRPSGLAAAVLVAQAALHAVFALTSGVGAPTRGSLHGPALHQHGQVLIDTVGSVPQLVLPSPPMLTAHALAAIASFVLLFAGERMLRTVAAWTLRLLDRATVTAAGSFPVPRATFPDVPAQLIEIARGVVRRRGPPLPWGDASVA